MRENDITKQTMRAMCIHVRMCVCECVYVKGEKGGGIFSSSDV